MAADDNRRAAQEFLRQAFVAGEPEAAVERFVGPSYTQHSPGLGEGVEPFVAFVRGLLTEYPGLELDIRRTVADRDLVALHTRVVGIGTAADGKPAEHAAVDIYRFDTEGRIVEHWEVIQEVPSSAANDNTMF